MIKERYGQHVLRVDKWADSRKLAYELKGLKRGTFMVVWFRSAPDQVKELERDLRPSQIITRESIENAVAVIMALGLILVTFLFTRRHWGDPAALLAAALVAFLPDVLGHGGVAYSDLPVTLAELLQPLSQRPRCLILNLLPLHPSESFLKHQSKGAAVFPKPKGPFGAVVK